MRKFLSRASIGIAIQEVIINEFGTFTGSLSMKNNSKFGNAKSGIGAAFDAGKAAGHFSYMKPDIAVNILKQPSDQLLVQSVEKVLILMNIFSKDAVSVSVKNGWMTLNGNLHWQFQRDVTVASLCSLHGITGFTDNIVVLHSQPE